jgi:hypothetical protein
VTPSGSGHFDFAHHPFSYPADKNHHGQLCHEQKLAHHQLMRLLAQSFVQRVRPSDWTSLCWVNLDEVPSARWERLMEAQISDPAQCYLDLACSFHRLGLAHPGRESLLGLHHYNRIGLDIVR